MKQTSLIYKYPSLYTWFIKFLYRRHYASRYRAISDEIEDNTSVIEICCGDCALYVQALKNRVSYTGIDINPYFINRAAHLSINVRLLDVFKDTLPDADYVVMQGSLYQFIPHHKKIVENLLNSCRHKVIISEPIRNISNSTNRIISFIARYSVNPGTGDKVHRFTETSYREFFNKYFKGFIEKFAFIPGKRELMVVLKVKNKGSEMIGSRQNGWQGSRGS